MSTATPLSIDVEGDEQQEPRSSRGTPVWEVAHLYPLQGDWDEQDYLAMETNHLIEFEDGFVELLPMPTRTHQRILLYLCDLLRAATTAKQLGEVLVAPFRVRLRSGKYREPDIVYAARDRKIEEQFVEGADLVIEVVSLEKRDRDRDLVQKPLEYAAAGIPEYWIVDPKEQTVTVLALDGEQYRVHGEFNPGETATSVLLEGFAVDVTVCFAAASDGVD